MNRSFVVVLSMSVAALAGACGGASTPAPVPNAEATVAFPAIDGTLVLEHTKVLASDEFEDARPARRAKT